MPTSPRSPRSRAARAASAGGRDPDGPGGMLATARRLKLLYLGPLECWSGGREVRLGGPLERTLLAALLAKDLRPVPISDLVAELWGKVPPARAENALQAHVSRLRKRLSVAIDGDVLPLTSSGYCLRTPEGSVDGVDFLRVVGNVRGGGQHGQDRTAEILRAALRLWRGPPFGGVAVGPLCRAAAGRLDAERLSAIELLYDTELQRGRHFEIVPELSYLLESSSLHERLCEQLMIALYRSGRQTDALAVFRRMRRRLDAELGVDPSPALRRIEQSILVHDARLAVTSDHRRLRSD
ncbi:MAG: AfsR/SARP family transcriptional regulator [Actinomycetia bacterium]|nr:AfsR/SARP family transcriptional regulator [Actinomycetes bacterium]